MGFDVYSNFKSNAGVSSVVFGAEKPILESELNELQEIGKYSLRNFINKIVGDGITNLSAIRYAGGILTIDKDCALIVDGIVINCTGLSFNVLSAGQEDNSIYLQVWEETVDSTKPFKEEGNQQSNITVPNWEVDSRISVETSRRRVVKYTLSNTKDSNKHNLLIARIKVNLTDTSVWTLTKCVDEVNLKDVDRLLDTVYAKRHSDINIYKNSLKVSKTTFDKSVCNICNGLNEMFCVSDNKGNIRHTKDFITYFGDSYGLDSSLVYDVICCGKDRIVAVGYKYTGTTLTSKAFYSLDGYNWVEMKGLSPTVRILDIAYGGGKFILVGENGVSYYSFDGYTLMSMTGLEKFNYDKVCFGDGKFLAVCGSSKNVAIHDINSIAINRWDLSSYDSTYISCVNFYKGRFVIGGRNSDNTKAVIGVSYEHTLSNWTWYSKDTNVGGSFDNIAFDNGVIVAVDNLDSVVCTAKNFTREGEVESIVWVEENPLGIDFTKGDSVTFLKSVLGRLFVKTSSGGSIIPFDVEMSFTSISEALNYIFNSGLKLTT